jgi:hypothetical protein
MTLGTQAHTYKQIDDLQPQQTTQQKDLQSQQTTQQKDLQSQQTTQQKDLQSQQKHTTNQLRGFSPQLNYTDRATAACRRS